MTGWHSLNLADLALRLLTAAVSGAAAAYAARVAVSTGAELIRERRDFSEWERELTISRHPAGRAL